MALLHNKIEKLYKLDKLYTFIGNKFVPEEELYEGFYRRFFTRSNYFNLPVDEYETLKGRTTFFFLRVQLFEQMAKRCHFYASRAGAGVFLVAVLWTAFTTHTFSNVREIKASFLGTVQHIEIKEPR